MRRAFFFLGLLLSAVLLGACTQTPPSSPQSTPSPSYDQFALDRYPLIAEKRPMTDAELVKLGLHRATLGRDTFFFNHYRGLCPKGQICGKWEWLPAGIEIAQDPDGRAWYKTDCSNRLFEPVQPTSPSWWPFGGGGPRWPWWLPWLLLLPLLGLLAYLVGRRRGERWEPLPPRSRPGNGSGNGHGRPDSILDVPGRTTASGESAAAAGVAAGATATAAKPAAATPTVTDPKSDGVKALIIRVSKIETDIAGVKAELTKLGETSAPTPPQPASTSAPATPVTPAPAPTATTTRKLTLAEAQDLCLRHIKLERRGIRALYARWDAGKISDEEFLSGVEAILAD